MNLDTGEGGFPLVNGHIAVVGCPAGRNADDVAKTLVVVGLGVEAEDEVLLNITHELDLDLDVVTPLFLGGLDDRVDVANKVIHDLHVLGGAEVIEIGEAVPFAGEVQLKAVHVVAQDLLLDVVEHPGSDLFHRVVVATLLVCVRRAEQPSVCFRNVIFLATDKISFGA